MKKVIPLLGLILLTGCDPFFHGFIKSVDGSQPKTVLIMGQSNALYFSTTKGGEEGFNSIVPGSRFINCAVGGTSLEQWKKGQALYTACLQMVGNQKVDAIWWDQGEYEAGGDLDGTGFGASGWTENFTVLANQMKADFKAPIFFARLGPFNNGPWWDIIRADQENVSHSLATMVSLDGIPQDESNHSHYTKQGYYEIGKRLALIVKER